MVPKLRAIRAHRIGDRTERIGTRKSVVVYNRTRNVARDIIFVTENPRDDFGSTRRARTATVVCTYGRRVISGRVMNKPRGRPPLFPTTCP